MNGEAPARKTEKPEAARPVVGTMSVSTSGPMAVMTDGRSVGLAPTSLSVRETAGRLQLSGGGFKYTVTLDYRVVKSGLALRIDTEPWSIVRQDGISLGRTPQGPISSKKRHRLSFVRPGQDAPLTIEVGWSPQ